MNRLILTVGLPRSGKSTWAKQYAAHFSGVAIVNPDSIRLALHGQRFALEAEPHVWAIARTMVKALFLAGHHTVILDATNRRANNRKSWQSPDWTVVVHVESADAETCIARARACGQDDLVDENVIARMYRDLIDPLNAVELLDYERV